MTTMPAPELTVTQAAARVSPDPLFGSWLADTLVWLPERGMGYYPVTERPYDAEYFSKYEEYADTPEGQAITDLRVRMVNRHAGPECTVVDVGIGCGAFVEARPRTFGYDINPVAVDWLKQRGRWMDPRRQKVEAATFWDVIEHIHDAHRVLANVTSWVFCALPIFTGPEHVLRSRHFRKDEHCWYWTRDGLIRWMAVQGFRCVEHGTPESLICREDIHSFAFRRTG